MSESIPHKFVSELISIGVVSYSEQETLWQIARRCARTAGVPMAGAGAVALAGAGSVALPVIGTVSGAVAGALAGLASGTVSCTMLNVAHRNELRRLAQGRLD